jgi:hypothetical protein
MSKRTTHDDHEREEDRALEALLVRLRPRAAARSGWEDAFAARVLARSRAELVRRTEAPSLWQLLTRWPAPLVPAAAAALAAVLLVVGNDGFSAAARAHDGSDLTAALAGDPLSVVVTDPVLALFVTDVSSETAPAAAPEVAP